MTRVTGTWFLAPETQAVMQMLEAGGYLAYFVGGCVRNDLLGAAVSDMDISTNALPQQVMALAEGAGLKTVPTGIEHGTVTVISNGAPHEITTFRADVETDGRRAVVAFSGDIAEDAVRRDLTMNALYADRTGEVIDPLGGLPDLRARRVRFILNATDRIREDYLRSLRFFRFAAWYGDPDQGFDAEHSRQSRQISTACKHCRKSVSGRKCSSCWRPRTRPRRLRPWNAPAFCG